MATAPRTDLLWVGGYGDGAGHPTLAAYPVADLLAGAMPEPVAALHPPDASWAAFTPGGTALHVVSETATGLVTSIDTAAAVSGAGDRAVLGRIQTGGAAPCHAAVSPDGRRLAVANYGDGVVTVLALGTDGHPTGDVATLSPTGSGPVRERQRGPHAHQVIWLAGDRLLVPDLGADVLRVLALGPAAAGPDPGLREMATVPDVPGSGPRHAALLGRPGGNDAVLVLVEELSAKLSWWEPTGGAGAAADPGTWAQGLRRRAGVPVLAGGGGQPSGVVVATGSAGTVVHVAVRGAGVVTTFATGTDQSGPPERLAETACGGSQPRSLIVSGGILWVADQDAAVVGIELDPHTGIPQEAVVRLAFPDPAWLAVAPPPDSADVPRASSRLQRG